MATFDWSKFHLKIYINAPLALVYDNWTHRRQLENWFLRKAAFTSDNGGLRGHNEQVQVGDTYDWTWHGYPDSNGEQGDVLEMNGTNRFAFRFGKAGIVTVQLKELAGLTEMLLTQSEIPTDEKSKSSYHVGCSTGWTFYFANLKSILEGGLDLRNKNPELTNVINA